MPWGAAIAVAGSLAAGAISASAAGDAADQISNADKAAITAVTGTQQKNVDTITANEQPYRDLGTQAVGSLATGEAPGGQFTKNFTLADLTTDPGYQFDLQQGNQAVQRSAAAQGTLNSGGTLKSIANYTTGLASNELTNAYNRYTTDQNNQFNRLNSLAGLGQNATTAVNQADTNQANVVSNAQYGGTIAAGQAQAAGTIGAANAIGGSITSATSEFAPGGTLSSLLSSATNSSNGSSTKLPGNAYPQ